MGEDYPGATRKISAQDYPSAPCIVKPSNRVPDRPASWRVVVVRDVEVGPRRRRRVDVHPTVPEEDAVHDRRVRSELRGLGRVLQLLIAKASEFNR